MSKHIWKRAAFSPLRVESYSESQVQREDLDHSRAPVHRRPDFKIQLLTGPGSGHLQPQLLDAEAGG